jgi:hypothetical protein
MHPYVCRQNAGSASATSVDARLLGDREGGRRSAGFVAEMITDRALAEALLERLELRAA